MTTLLPPNSRVTLNDTMSPVTLPSSISVSFPCRPVIVPVSFSPACLSFRVVSKVWPFRSTDHFQVPVTSAARAGLPRPSTTASPRAAANHQPLARCLIVAPPDRSEPDDAPGACLDGTHDLRARRGEWLR